MPADAWRIGSGLVVLVAGLATAIALNGRGDDPAESRIAAVVVAETSTTAAAAATPVETRSPSLPGVADSVARVLQWSGNAGFADSATQAEIPPAVVDALVAYGVPIAVPSSEPSG